MAIEGPRHELALEDAAYPPLVRDLARPPKRLYVVGDPAALVSDSVSIIGSRKATTAGVACARLAARESVAAGLQVVSGAALGCDQAAQREALRLGGRVVAVLGCGADVTYPSGSAQMLQEMVDGGGAVVSTQPWGSPPARWAFVARNSVIAALSRALVICEAGLPSGTFTTAYAAEELGREVLVFPGSFFSPNSKGCNYLIAESQFIPIWDERSLDVALSRVFGILVPSPARGQERKDPTEGCVGDAARVMGALAAMPEMAGALAQGLEMEPGRVMRALGDLTSRGLVKRLADGRYSPSLQALLGDGGRRRPQPATSGRRRARAETEEVT